MSEAPDAFQTTLMEELSSNLRATSRKLNLLLSWIQLKFGDDPTLPRSLYSESADIKPEFPGYSESPVSDLDVRGDSDASVLHYNLHGCKICDKVFPSLHQLRLHETRHCYVRVERVNSAVIKSDADSPPYSPLYVLPTSWNQDENDSTGDHHDNIPMTRGGDEEVKTEKATSFPVGSKLRFKPKKCKYCGEVIMGKKNLLGHIYINHRARWYPCPSPGCSRKFVHQRRRKNHILSVHAEAFEKGLIQIPVEAPKAPKASLKKISDKQVPCPVNCGKMSKTLEGARQHMQRYHRSEITPEFLKSVAQSNFCNFCGKTYRNMESFKKHLRIFHPEDYLCRIENGQLATRLSMADHEKILAETRKPVQCTHCGVLIFKSRLASHMATHGERVFKCPHCEHSTHSKGSLKVHMDRHSEVRKYQCSLCPYAARQKSGLDAHNKRAHETTRAQCTLCGELFKSRVLLGKHIVGVHENRRPHQCHLCDKAFKMLSHLKYHLRTHENPKGRKRGLNKEREPKRRAPNKPSQNLYSCLSENAAELSEASGV